MTAKNKYILYQMIYRKMLKTTPLYPRGYSKSFFPHHFRVQLEAFEKTNYILAAINESIAWNDILIGN